MSFDKALGPQRESPAFPFDDFQDLNVSLDEVVALRMPGTYLVRVEGDSMIGAGIFSGDLLIVDRSLDAKHGEVVIAAVNGEPVCKRLHNRDGLVILQSENKRYPSRYIIEGDEFEVWGVVRHSIRDHAR